MSKSILNSQGSIRTFAVSTLLLVSILFSMVSVQSNSVFKTNLNLSPVKVKVEVAKEVDLPEVVDLNAKAVKVTPQEIKTKLKGKLIRKYVSLGQNVRAGQELFQLDYGVDLQYLSSLESEILSIEKQVSLLGRLEKTLPEQWEEYRLAKQRLEDAQKKRDSIQLIIADQTIRSPISGMIQNVSEVKDGIDAGFVLATIKPTSSFYVYLDVPVKYSANIKLDQRVELYNQDSNSLFSGRISSYKDYEDYFSKNRTYEIVLDTQPGFLDKNNHLLAKIKIGKGYKALYADKSSVFNSTAGDKLYVIKNVNHGRHLGYYFSDPRFVITALKSAEDVYILSGMEEGQYIATEGAKNLKNFMRVEILN